ncbi:LacI family DNA-binding transcriptional regulator [Marinovum sp.]|uniref:LacI family DNA-binding transcriptional regulator n=1 Tax=Marinovum sp. TaxID=2024839 RepID=UPI002B274118|nr:LacI family DNA-binding transcriptional regulator [Marinovum sp.]
MKELSTAIGVSRPTLSRFFQDPESVSAVSRKKIQQALETVDYVPNFFFTRLNRKSTGVIGVILPHFNDPFFTSLLDVIELEAIKAGFTIITQGSHGDPELEARAAEKVLSMSPDGVLVAPLGGREGGDAFERLARKVPLVFVDSRPADTTTGIDFVGTDNAQSIGVIVNYLCRTGAPPALLGMPKLNSNSYERETAYIERMEALGHEPLLIDPSGVAPDWRFEEYGFNIMEAHFSRGRFDDSTILCANDRLAFGALRAANNHGLFPGGGKSSAAIRIAGHDDNPVSRFMTPSLTTMAQDVESLGRAAIHKLSTLIDPKPDAEETPGIQLFDAALRLRDSA